MREKNPVAEFFRILSLPHKKRDVALKKRADETQKFAREHVERLLKGG